jgi:hypothetical protein
MNDFVIIGAFFCYSTCIFTLGFFAAALFASSSRADEADEAKLHQAWIRRRLAD